MGGCHVSPRLLRVMVFGALTHRFRVLWGCKPRGGIIRLYGNSVSPFEKRPVYFPQPLCSCAFPPAVREGPGFSTSLSMLVVVCLRDAGPPSG